MTQGRESDTTLFKPFPFLTILHKVDSIFQKQLQQYLPSCPSHNLDILSMKQWGLYHPPFELEWPFVTALIDGISDAI